MEEKALTVTEAAQRLNVHRETLLRWIHEGKIKASKPGRDWRIRGEEVERLLKGED